MAKLQQYFAQSDEKHLRQTEKDTDEVDVLVLAIDEAPLDLSTPQTNDTSLLPEPEKTEGQKSIGGLMDVDRHQVPAAQTHTEERDNIPVIHPEVITSKSQTRQPSLDSVNSHKSAEDSQLLEICQDKETLTSQTTSLKCQTSDKSIGKSVEKAWECFEKCAMERIGNIEDSYSTVGKADHVNNMLLENNQGSQSLGHHYTFETIVAPLYHQVFERMENNRRGIKKNTPKADESVGKVDDGSLKVITYPRVETRSNPEISAKHVNDDEHHGACKETFPEYLHNTTSATENALSVLNMKTKLVEEITFQEATLPDITGSLCDANISESKAAQEVIPIAKQHSSNSESLASWDRSTSNQREQTPDMNILQNEHSDGTEHSLDNNLPYSGYSLDTLEQDLKCIDSAILPTHSEAETRTAKWSLAIFSENPQSEDRSVTEASFEPQVSDEINKIQDKEAQTSERTFKCLEESYTPVPDSDNSSNATPKMIQSEASPPSNDLKQANSRPQIPATVSFTQSLQATGATVPQLQTTDDTSVIQQTTNTWQISDTSHHIRAETKSNLNDRNVDNWEKMENDTEIVQTELLHWSPEERDGDRISQNLLDVSQIDEDEDKHRMSHLSFSDEITDCDELLVKDMAMSNISSNLEDASEKEEEEAEGNQEVLQVMNPSKNKKQEFTDMAENQSEEVKEINDVGKQLQEKEQKRETQDQIEKEEQESDERVELGNEDEFKDEPVYTKDDEDVKKDDTEKVAASRRNGVEKEKEKEKDLEVEIEEQEMVGGITSVATLQSIPNIDSSRRDVHQHLGPEQGSEQPVSERHSSGEEEEIFCGADSSQQGLTLTSDLRFSDRVEELEDNSDFFQQEEDVCCQKDKEHVAEDGIGEVDVLQEKQEEHSENMDDSASTESLTDDEMELYLLRLKNTQQPGLKDVISIGKRHSISRTWTVPSPMPSISENMDEDQPNVLLDDLTNEQMTELERASLPLTDEEEEVVEPNFLWWREFFSSDNMPKMIVYTLLLVVFLITTYICDFIACFGLYLLALYWLYFQVQREPLKGT